jgi:hypothetical protein
MAIDPKGPAKEALNKLIEALGMPAKSMTKGVVTTPMTPMPPLVMPKEQKLLAVKVWQEMTYLVKCDPATVNVDEVVADPMNRIAKVGEGVIKPTAIIEIRDATTADLEAASPTKALVI